MEKSELKQFILDTVTEAITEDSDIMNAIRAVEDARHEKFHERLVAKGLLPEDWKNQLS
jgi:hypothetical protein